LLLHAYVITALHPRCIVFFAAFAPQLVNVSASVLPQFALLEETLVALVALNVAVWGGAGRDIESAIPASGYAKIGQSVIDRFLLSAGLLTTTIHS
jgi:threonine/homoserine/homoserine lactone efflux protein